MCKYLSRKPDNLTSLLGTQAKELSDVTCTCHPTVYGEMGCRDEVNRKLMDLQAVVECTANKGDSDSKRWKPRASSHDPLTSIQAHTNSTYKILKYLASIIGTRLRSLSTKQLFPTRNYPAHPSPPPWRILGYHTDCLFTGI